MAKKKKPLNKRRRFGSPADVRDILRDYHTHHQTDNLRPKGTYCIKCGLRIYLVQNAEGEQFYVVSMVRRNPPWLWGKRNCAV